MVAAGNPRHSWLAPRPTVGNATNRVIIPIHNGTIISALLITNYAKTPTRGAKLVDILLDDVLIYQGYLRMYSEAKPAQCVLLSAEPKMVAKYERMVYRGVQQVEEIEPVVLFNDGKQQMSKGSKGTGRGDLEPRPATAVV